jgi:hydrogenase maturation factor
VQILVNPGTITVLDPTRQLCAHFGIEPMGLLGSGGLLIALSKQDFPKVQVAFRVRGFLANLIGEASEVEGVYALRGNKKVSLPIYEQDELTKVL